MDAVGKLGSYISRGVVTVSAPFHPFGGAVDIIVVEQPDGSLKSSPWYVQFGKFQGVLKAREKVVSINVNGVDADFRMYLDSKGRAHFLIEVVEDEVLSESIGSSGDNTDQSSSVRRPEKIVSCNSELQRLKRVSEFEASNQKKMTRSNTTGPRVLGFVFGRRSWKEKRLLNRANVVGWDRKASLEHAEMAADLLELRWSTGLPTRKHRKDIALCSSDPRFCIRGDNRSEVDSCRLPQSSCFHDKGEAEILLSTSPVNYMESFTLEETYLDVDFTECSVGSSGGDTGDVKRMQRVESSIYCDTSESFMDRLDSSSGDSSESLSCSVSGEMDVPTEILGGEQELISKVHSGLSSRILVCEVDVNGENMEDKGLCRSIDGSKSCSVADSDVETMLETKVDVESNTTESPVKHVEEIVVNQIPSNEEPSLTNSCVIEEITCSVLDSKENSRSEKPSIPASTDLLLHMGSCENIDSPVASMNESSRNAFQVEMTNAVIPEKTGEQFLSNFDSSEVNSIVSVPFTSTDSLTKEISFQDFGKSCEDVRKPNETQFFFSDVHGSELTKTMDMQLTTLDSLEAEIDPQYCPKSSEEKLGESTKMLNESHSFRGQLIQEDHLHDDQLSSPDGSRTISSPISINRVQELAEQTAQTVESLPSFCSHYSEMNDQGSNCLISHSLDLSSDNMRLAHGDVPTTLETGELNGQSTLRQSSTEHMQITEELRKILSNPAVEISFCRHLLYEGMGQEAAAQAFDAEKLDFEKLVSLSSDVIRNDRVVVRIGGLYFPWDAALPIISAVGSPTGEQILEPNGMITIDLVENGAERDPQQSIDSSNSGPSIATIPTDSERCIAEETDTLESASIKKKMEWSKTPTSEQLASLNLKKGKNEVIFTFSSPVLGEQKVDARIYLWKWNARIVVSDVDGTITKSDVLGQFMPLVGVDWSQTGVAHLFSAIKENGYELLFLSARAISQASLTRQFLFNLKQEGKSLPEGPVVISPDGLFPSLIREVIRRAPHEFKIACLEDIRALFPPDHNPFYAGFGNRDTDELSYLKVGMPKGKIFIINPKGEVAVQRRVDRKTYKSLHTVVHDMFPPPSSASSPEQEDFNSWNFWRLPPPEVV